MGLLSSDQLDLELATVPAWTRDGDRIVRTIEAPSFLGALDLVNAIGRAAEDADHHPDIDIRWRTVTLALSTHDAGGLTEKDFALALVIDELVP